MRKADISANGHTQQTEWEISTPLTTNEAFKLVLTTTLPLVYFQVYSKAHFDILMNQESYANHIITANQAIKSALKTIPLCLSRQTMLDTQPMLLRMNDALPTNTHQLFIAILQMALASIEHLHQLKQFLEENSHVRIELGKHKTLLLDTAKTHYKQLISFSFRESGILPQFLLKDLTSKSPKYFPPDLLLFLSPLYSHALFIDRANIKLQSFAQALEKVNHEYDNFSTRKLNIIQDDETQEIKGLAEHIKRKISESKTLLNRMVNPQYPHLDPAKTLLDKLFLEIESKITTLTDLFVSQIDAYYSDSETESDDENTDEAYNDLQQAKQALFYNKKGATYGTAPPYQGPSTTLET